MLQQRTIELLSRFGTIRRADKVVLFSGNIFFTYNALCIFNYTNRCISVPYLHMTKISFYCPFTTFFTVTITLKEEREIVICGVRYHETQLIRKKINLPGLFTENIASLPDKY